MASNVYRLGFSAEGPCRSGLGLVDDFVLDSGSVEATKMARTAAALSWTWRVQGWYCVYLNSSISLVDPLAFADSLENLPSHELAC